MEVLWQPKTAFHSTSRHVVIFDVCFEPTIKPRHVITSKCDFNRTFSYPSSETQGQLVGSIKCSWWKFSVRSRRARLDLTENFHHEHFIDPTNCPWVSEDVSYLDFLNMLKVLRFSFPVPIVGASAKDFYPLQRAKFTGGISSCRFYPITKGFTDTPSIKPDHATWSVT